MSLKYYRKLCPDTPVALSNGAHIKFSSLDAVQGFFATLDESVQGEFERAMRENRYAISEISHDEYVSSYLEKKRNGTKPLYAENLKREEMGSGMRLVSVDPISQIGVAHVAKVVGIITEPSMETSTQLPAPRVKPASKDKPAESFNPPVARRKKPQSPS